MKYDQIKELLEEQFRKLTGVKKATFKKMLGILREADEKKKAKGGRKSKLSVRRNPQFGVESTSLEKCNTKTQRYEDTKSEDEFSHQVICASIEVNQTLGGPGLLESIYEAALCHEPILRGLRVHRQRPVQVSRCLV
jgi:hypothetical protein